MRNDFVLYTRYFRVNKSRRVRREGPCSMLGGNDKHKWSQKIGKDLSGGLGVCGSIILKYKIKTRLDVTVCTQFIWFIIGSGVDFVRAAMNLKIL